MANYPLPDPRMENPGMFLPGKKPIGPVAVDWDHHALVGARYIVFASDNKLQISGRNANSFAVSGQLESWRGYVRPNSAEDRITIPALGSDWRTAGSLFLAGEWDGTDYGGGFARLLSEPTIDLVIQSGSNWAFINGFGGTTIPRQSGKQSIAVTSTGGFSGTRVAYNNGAAVNVDTNSLSLSNVDDNLTLFNHPSIDRAIYFGLGVLGVWDRTLSDSEIANLHANPDQFLVPA